MRFIMSYFTYFLIYSFLGWVLETSYASIKAQTLIKRRGTFTHYFLPLYGGCAVMIVMLFAWIQNRFLAAVLSGIAVTVFEYITGWVLDQKLQMKLWDYSTCKWHLGGYVCLPFTIIWCVLAYFLAVWIHPYIGAWFSSKTETVQLFVLTIGILLYGIDLMITQREQSIYS